MAVWGETQHWQAEKPGEGLSPRPQDSGKSIRQDGLGRKGWMPPPAVSPWAGLYLGHALDYHWAGR